MIALKSSKTLAELAQQYDVHPKFISQWRARQLKAAAEVFGSEQPAVELAVDVTVLYAYDYARPLKTLRGLTLYETICKAWTDDPSQFISNPHHQSPEPST